MKCHSCGNVDLSVLTKFENVVENVQHLPAEADHCGHTVDLELLQCLGCGLVQIDPSLDRDYYDDYLMTTSFSNQLQDYLENLAQDFYAQHLWPGATVLDVGCGDGAFMQAFRELPVTLHGIEPSCRAAEQAQQQGFQVMTGYITADTVLPHAPYDAFVSRQVLEHVSDIPGFLRGICQNLAPGGVGIIEVPSLDKTVGDGRWFDFFPDHVNYFDTLSLRTALNLHGFDVLRQDRGMHDEYEIAFVRRRDIGRIDHLRESRISLVRSLTSFLDQQRKRNRVTMFWGAGAKGIGMLSQLDRTLVTAVLDSDSHKQGRYLPVSGIPVLDPDQHVNRCDVIVITALAYYNAIHDKLINQYGFAGEIWVVHRDQLRQLTRP